MQIHGIGIISSVGRGLDVHRAALAAGVSAAGADGFYRVTEKDLKDPLLAKAARRAGRFDRMAILAGLDALNDAGIKVQDTPSAIGLILATSLGPHVTTFRFLDDLINFKEQDVSPTLFSHSVHNAAASYLSLLAGIRGPTLTVTRFTFAFREAVTLAHAWLEQKRCAYVLVGVVDEMGAVMEAAGREIAGCSSGFQAATGEGSVFLVLSNELSRRGYGSMSLLPASLATETLVGRQPCQDAFNFVFSIIKNHQEEQANES
ncbi:MAG: beta-ketoacyl synthase chain length factor [Candidatus Omnitrophica bacterium]|nr:beta-ketoacyl synthase chain length factor [Candidatus Omnitrophota bacterium]